MSWFGLVVSGSGKLRCFDVSCKKIHQQDQAVLLHVSAPQVSLHGRYFPQARLGGLLCRFGQKLNRSAGIAMLKAQWNLGMGQNL
jgi:hypothetical protein